MTARSWLACLLLVAGGVACGPGAAGDRPGPGPGGLVPTRTPPGPAIAPEVGVSVSADVGGTLTSPDGALTITVPAGAVAGPTELTLTPIRSTARGGVGAAFRLGPEGTRFASPVTLTFQAPDAYAIGTGFGGLGVEYQDAQGYWHRVDAASRDAAAHTITVESTHFSDWTLTWQGGTPAAEGTITLLQTIGIPLTATGNATLHYQGDDAYDSVYVLTGTLTLPDSFTVGESTCVPTPASQTLPLSVAEVHKSSPPVFRWGLGVSWTITCTDGGGVETTEVVPAQFDTMQINLTRCPADYAGGQVVSASRLAGSYAIDCSLDAITPGMVTASWDLSACRPGLDCLPAECHVGTTACDASFVETCVDGGAALDGTACGTPDAPGTCSAGGCVIP